MGSYNDKEIQNVVDLILKDYEDERTINAMYTTSRIKM